MTSLPRLLNRISRFRSWPVLMLGGVVLIAGSLGAPATSHSQTGGATVALRADAFSALVSQLRSQQDQLSANQTKIETQIAAAKEEVRLAKIAAARSGSAGRR